MSLTLHDVSHAVRETQYAVRGAIVARAAELERQGRRIIYCNIGNPQSLGQAPLTALRQLLALCEWPALLEGPAAQAFPEDVRAAARLALGEIRHGVGAYTESKGYRFVRQAVADFVHARDGIPADAEHVFLTDGASKGVQSVLRLLVDGPADGVMIPIPQYPLYSASITLLGGTQVSYFLDESREWSLSLEALETAHAEAAARGVRVRAIAVINPGNPTGAVLDEANVAMVLDFARRHGLAVLADEVYQENVYRPGDRFVSFASVLVRRGIADVPLFSFHSVSKGFLGECGHRGGYLECRNVADDVMAQVEKLQSVALCANSVGQLVTWFMVRPPRPGDASHPLYERERNGVLDSLRRRAARLQAGLDAIPGIQCNALTGAMYAFPRITLPPGATDAEYCLALLEQTGICVVPGSGFGQLPGTWHFRTTILPPDDEIEMVVARLGEFHARFTKARGG
ncbi:MAG TPA: aminotransferase class I/II-fold pyridoxal phosphate-dependent enzyme [Anaeromyxobacteraceae bacterium]|nr:aminotransferase class I/II-fold pyridoxal phosphate-dependent enzyme [Anaeromyxobacteraceae bacterium]